MEVKNINEQEFENEVLKSDIPVLVDFWAPWCGPCKMLGPIVEQVAQKTQGVKVVKLNVDDAISTAQKYGVVSIPTLIVFNGGKEVKRSVGLISEQQVSELIK
jgi:thioredoxin 1